MKLYYFPGSCALAPNIVLEWAGAAYEAIRIQKGDPEYRKINPLGVVPALDVGGKILTQADAILHYLAARFPAAEVGGGGTPESDYVLNNWMAFLTGDLHPAFFPFFAPHRYTTAELESHRAQVKDAAQKLVDKYYSHMNAHLEGRQFLAGDHRTIADAYAIPMLRWGRLLRKPLTDYGALNDYLDRWEQDAGVKRALEAQGLQ